MQEKKPDNTAGKTPGTISSKSTKTTLPPSGITEEIQKYLVLYFDKFFLTSPSTAECMDCGMYITTDSLGDLGQIVDGCITHECDM